MSSMTYKNGEAPVAPEAARSVTVAPRVDVLETEDEFLVIADLPGVKSEDVDIRFEKSELTIHGRRVCGRDSEPAHREYEATDFHRVFGLADTIAADRISAELKNGVLTVQLPKVEAVKPKKIAVRG